MTVHLGKAPRQAIPVHLTDSEHWSTHAASLDPSARRWLQASGFSGAPDSHALVPAADGRIAAVWAG
ncbi:MAG: leucyl aminopeptidase family protein, partial [Burkholderiales bacterium]|nr:leucyl aminopeptidase family protein [Burkholderiales bacterium]